MLIKNKKSVIKQIVFYTGIFAVISLFLKFFLTGSVVFFDSDFETEYIGDADNVSIDISHLNENDQR